MTGAAALADGGSGGAATPDASAALACGTGTGAGAGDVEHAASGIERSAGQRKSPTRVLYPNESHGGTRVGMTLLTVPDGKDPLAHRAEMTAKYAERAFDMVRTTWVCSACNAEVAPPPVMFIPFARYRSLDAAAQSVAEATTAALADGAAHDPCARCGGASRLAFADMHFFSSALATDLVARHTPGAAPALFTWSQAAGAQPHAPTADLDRAIARDALIRTIAAEKHEDEDACMAALEEALVTIPGDVELLAYLPWVNGRGNLDLSRRIAAATVARRPEEAGGHFWLAQATVEEVGAGAAPKDKIAEAVPLLERAIALRPDYPDAQIALANVARIRGRDDDAEKALRALIANHPTHPEANYTLGLVLLAKNPAEALACFERGEQASPEDADYPRSRARALIALGRNDEAKVAIARAKELAPNDQRIDQVAAQIGSGGSKGATGAIRIVVGLVLVGTVLAIGWIVMGAMKSPDAPAAKPPAPAVAPATPPKKK